MIEIYYGLPADFGVFGHGLSQYMVECYERHLEWNIEQLKENGAKEIRWCYQDDPLGSERWV